MSKKAVEINESAIPNSDLEPKSSSLEYESRRDAIARRLRLKLDLRLVPYLALLYLFNSLDRSNIGNARLAGLEADTHLEGNDFYSALSLFYAGYALSQVPNMFIFKKVTPSMLIGVTMVLWGVCSTSMAAANNRAGLIAARFFMGIFESGVGIGAPIVISFFYMPNELAWRQALYFGSSTFAGAFGGLIAYGVATHLANEQLAPWRLLFIIEGIPTIFLGILSFFLLPNSPENLENWFVTPSEKQVAIERAQTGYNTDTSLLDKRQLIAAFTDYKNIFYCVIYIGVNVPLASYQSFLPTIVKLMGYTNAKAQLMTVPPYALGANYAGACLVAMGIYPIVPLMLSWVANNNIGHTKRAISLAMMNTCGQCFATVGTQIFKDKTAPRFILGYSICIAFTGVMMIMSLALVLVLKHDNAARQSEFGNPRPLDDEEQREVINSGIYDRYKGFRYYI
ncbi:hypothetical protein LPJ53_000330 [Coemansia erecta]|uniref:Major facilitator superfamily (MFS) profile domain-containing protein n=1 Tax=Coemansia erecta TaxID=147472 RepID=A0A9W8CTA8_9FUNG|nr:hypothetical protein LPJ53_000330 [Coemansia erecta]